MAQTSAKKSRVVEGGYQLHGESLSLPSRPWQKGPVTKEIYIVLNLFSGAIGWRRGGRNGKLHETNRDETGRDRAKARLRTPHLASSGVDSIDSMTVSLD